MKFHVVNKIRKDVACAVKTGLIISIPISYRNIIGG